VHDVGLHIRQKDGVTGFEVWVGGGQGRTPVIATLVNSFVPETQILDYLEAIMRVYNRYGRRDNKYKARIKILVTELGEAEYIRQVEAEFAAQRDTEKINLPKAEVERIHAYFAPPELAAKPETSKHFEAAKVADPAFARWTRANLHPHKVAGYTSVTVSLKPLGVAPGDATDKQMEVVADLAEKYGYGDIRVSHAQNLILPHVALDDVPEVYKALDAAGLGAANESRITDMIVCPGLDFCNLANARSIPVALEVQKVFADPAYEEDIGKLHINVSGCINACGHHHVGHIGILGVDKKGEEFYQILLGGRADEKAALGEIVGPGLKAEEVPGAIHRVVEFYRAQRTSPSEKFIDTLERLGHQPFQDALYAAG
ncbi:MAG: nitrite/sulfite reductase, partial [Hyphomonas sp.]|nr:nitrite/sulfite reductase [Hyphomonas sp.]